MASPTTNEKVNGISTWMIGPDVTSVFVPEIMPVMTEKLDITMSVALRRRCSGESGSATRILSRRFHESEKKGFIYDSIRHFVDCIAEDRPPSVGVVDGLINTRVLCAVTRSAKTGEPVKV